MSKRTNNKIQLKILVCCNKKDFFLTRICVASIRYYYPDIEIYIIKNYGPGHFSSVELEMSMNVKVLDFGRQEYSISGTRMHFILSNAFAGEKVLILDSDIVFAGRFLESLESLAKGFDFAVSPEYCDDPYQESLYNLYYNLKNIHKEDTDFKYPGYFFNAGQILATSNIISTKEISNFYDLDVPPYYKRLDLFPFYDQGLLNYVLAKKEQKSELKVLKTSFMVWSETEFVRNLELEKVKLGEDYSFIIHWAGALRIPYISKMTQPAALTFFEDHYYRNVSFGCVKKIVRKIIPITTYYLKTHYSSVRRLMKLS